jgi:hypothetical protein
MLVPIRKMTGAEYDALCVLPTLRSTEDKGWLLKRDAYVEHKGKPCMERVWITTDSATPVAIERCEVLTGTWEVIALYTVED